ncbi:MAG: hypothetical protein WBL99_11515 [Candidatus Acidiferrales bacterium]
MKSKVVRQVFQHVFIGLVYLAVAYTIMSTTTARFETLALAILILIYAATLYNFSVIGAATDVNNYAGFVRFRILATAQGVTENEDGLFVDQEKQLRDSLENNAILIVIDRTSHGLVSLYILYRIIASIFFAS